MSEHMVLGFVFNQDFSEVALILRNRPKWQAGHYNGIGGHVETGENPYDAMIREAQEETGLLISQWDFILTMRREFRLPQFTCHVYRAWLPHKTLNGLLKTIEDQPIHIIQTNALPDNVLSNLRWPIPLCADMDIADGNNYEITGIVGPAKERGTA